MAADIAIFDDGEIASGDRPEARTDLPGGGLRLVMPSHGVHFTIVNGVVLFEAGRPSGDLPGAVLRA